MRIITAIEIADGGITSKDTDAIKPGIQADDKTFTSHNSLGNFDDRSYDALNAPTTISRILVAVKKGAAALDPASTDVGVAGASDD